MTLNIWDIFSLLGKKQFKIPVQRLPVEKSLRNNSIWSLIFALLYFSWQRLLIYCSFQGAILGFILFTSSFNQFILSVSLLQLILLVTSFKSLKNFLALASDALIITITAHHYTLLMYQSFPKNTFPIFQPKAQLKHTECTIIGKTINILQTDIEKISNLSYAIIQCIVNPIQIIILINLLTNYITVSALIFILLSHFICVFIIIWLNYYVNKQLLIEKDQRVNMQTNSEQSNFFSYQQQFYQKHIQPRIAEYQCQNKYKQFAQNFLKNNNKYKKYCNTLNIAIHQKQTRFKRQNRTNKQKINDQSEKQNNNNVTQKQKKKETNKLQNQRSKQLKWVQWVLYIQAFIKFLSSSFAFCLLLNCANGELKVLTLITLVKLPFQKFIFGANLLIQITYSLHRVVNHNKSFDVNQHFSLNKSNHFFQSSLNKKYMNSIDQKQQFNSKLTQNKDNVIFVEKQRQTIKKNNYNSIRNENKNKNSRSQKQKQQKNKKELRNQKGKIQFKLLKKYYNENIRLFQTILLFTSFVFTFSMNYLSNSINKQVLTQKSGINIGLQCGQMLGPFMYYLSAISITIALSQGIGMQTEPQSEILNRQTGDLMQLDRSLCINFNEFVFLFVGIASSLLYATLNISVVGVQVGFTLSLVFILGLAAYFYAWFMRGRRELMRNQSLCKGLIIRSFLQTQSFFKHQNQILNPFITKIKSTSLHYQRLYTCKLVGGLLEVCFSCILFISLLFISLLILCFCKDNPTALLACMQLDNEVLSILISGIRCQKALLSVERVLNAAKIASQ